MLQQFVVDAFENGPFTGNPAAVVPLESWLPDELMQQVGGQNNLSETAFFVPTEHGYHLRWFTPSDEVPLCGHATLVASHVLFEELHAGGETIRFESASGPLSVSRGEHGLELDFPSAPIEGAHPQSDAILAALGVPGEVLDAGGSAFVVLDSEATVTGCAPDMDALAGIGGTAFVVSAPAESSELDVVARVFAPQVGIPEDPATGSAYCALTPYWCERLGKSEIRSLQASERGGHFHCRLLETAGRVGIAGSCRTFARGSIELSR